MTEVAIASTDLRDSEAGEALAAKIRSELHGAAPDAMIVFASPQNDYAELLRALHSKCPARAMVGCSSAGEFTSETSGTGLTTVIALRAADMRFSASRTLGLSANRDSTARQLVQGFQGMGTSEYRYRTALILVDALAGHAEDFVDRLTIATGGMYRFVGGGAGDDGRFKETHVFFGTEAHTDAAVALEILSNKPIGIGARHGWTPAGDPLRVTQANNSCVLSLNVAPAVEAFEEHAAQSNQRFDRADPLPFFLHNVVGVKSDEGYKLRVPLGIDAEGGIICAAEVPTGVLANIMSTQAVDAADAAASATRDAMQQVQREGHTPKAALFFDCVATRLRLGQDFSHELDAVARELRDAPFAGFNSYGQIVRAEGQFSGFHNCTAVVCVFPE
ncbi:MAG: FIST C-terminal domain-containing protein [Gemmatimonadaceae bacterium]|nr:FIST C-terminal domain-containing protein [Gemmatimonadaceae bacterium]MDQ3519741.1 FIST C-terminal domain-containing protein [Gemmatimonadota bacterium]